MTEGEKEGAKLTANYCNGIAITLFAGGFLSIPLTYRDSTVPTSVVFLVGMCLAMSLGMHILARTFLSNLR